MRFGKLAAVVSLLSVTCLGFGQQADHPASSGKDPISLSVVVTPGHDGKPVADLTQSMFTLLDNGAPQRIDSFRAVSGQTQPVKMLIVIDDVNAPYERVAYERDQINRFLKANGGKLSQPTALAIFTDTSTQVQPGFSTDGMALSQELDKQVIGLRDLRRSSGFYGAAERLDLSITTLNQMVARAATQPGRKFLIWVTPGWPLLSGPGIQLTNKEQEHILAQVVGLSDALRRSNTTMYTINPLGAGANVERTFYYESFLKGLKKASEAEPADLGAQVLAVQSGGRALTGSNDLSGLLDQCFADASAQYEITFQPPPAESPNEYHRIQVHMADSKLVARTRTGYYAQP